MVPVIKDILWHGRTDLIEAVLMGLGSAVLFYGRWSLGEGLSIGKVRDAAFIFMGAGTWVGKLAHLAANPLTIWEGWWVIAQAITKCWVGARGPGHPLSHPTTPQPFRFYCGDESLREKCVEDASFDHWPSLHKPLQGRDCEWWQRNLRPMLPQSPSPSPDCGFKSDRSSVLTSLSVLSQSDRSEGSWHPHCGKCQREPRGHMKINLPIFKDEDTKDAITYQSWRWYLTVYHWAGCQDHTLLPYAIWSLQGYPGELMRSSEMDITLDNVLTILDEHYNNVKALDALNQELFQLQMGEKETMSDWGVWLSRHLQVLAASFPECFPLIVWLSWSVTTSMVGYPNISRPWWPTWRPAHRRRCTPTICEQQEMPKRKTPWNPPKAIPSIIQPNPSQPVSSPCRS